MYVTIPCNLQEFYNGCLKTITYERQQLALDGHTIKTQTQSKEIVVKPGFSPINHFTFRGEGHQMRKYKTDLIIQFQEVPFINPWQMSEFSTYKRKGNDLVYTASITLQQALNAEPVILSTLDGRKLAAPVDRIVSPGTVITIPYEGMPIYLGRHNDEVPKGNLYIKFIIHFPKTLKED